MGLGLAVGANRDAQRQLVDENYSRNNKKLPHYHYHHQHHTATDIPASMAGNKRALDADPKLASPKRAKKAHVVPVKLRVDDLAWREVAMPDRLDDVEGFFGLEEIDGVDVFGTGGGLLEFKVGAAGRVLLGAR